MNNNFDETLNPFWDNIGTHQVLTLSTSSNNRVSSRMVSVIISSGKFYFQTDKGFLKFRQLSENPNAALCFKNYSIEGTCRCIGRPDDEENAFFLTLFKKYFYTAYEMYTHIATERLIEFSPTLIYNWDYERFEPYMQYWNFKTHTYIKKKMEGDSMPFDYKKEYKEFYLPKNKPSIIDVPAMNFVAVRGQGDPNDEGGEYKQAMSLLYGIAFTIKMSKKGSHNIEGYFDYVVPPLEGLWWQEGIMGIDFVNKEKFKWISLIRLPDFVTKEVFDWAVKEASAKKKTDFSKAEFFTYSEGLCVQCMHIGSYDDEISTIEKMNEFANANGFEIDITAERMHHEIYLSDPRRTATERLKTVIRLPIKKCD